MKARAVIGVALLAFGMIGAVVANSLVYLARSGAAYGNPLLFGILSIGVAIVGIVVLVSWMFSELTSSSSLAAPVRAPEPAATADSFDVAEASSKQ